MSDLDTLAGLITEIETLKQKLHDMQRHHLQFVCTIVYALGGEMRITPQDYVMVPPGTQLHWMKDPATGDTVFKVTVPEAHEDAARTTQ